MDDLDTDAHASQDYAAVIFESPVIERGLHFQPTGYAIGLMLNLGITA